MSWHYWAKDGAEILSSLQCSAPDLRTRTDSAKKYEFQEFPFVLPTPASLYS